MSLKTIILVGGPSVGTRFRPLSMDCPKPLFPIAGSPTIYHHIQAVAKVPGMSEVLLIGFYDQHVFDRLLMECQLEFPHLSFRDEIMRGAPEVFFVMNADIASSFPLDQMLKYHRVKKGSATIMSIRVPKDTAHKYGCLVADEDGKVQHFVEKPETFLSDNVSCGIYLFDHSIFELINQAASLKEAALTEMGMELGQFNKIGKLGSASNFALSPKIERPIVQLETDVLKMLISEKDMLYAFVCDKRQFWMSVKTGSSTIEANRRYLQHFLAAHPRRLSTPVNRKNSNPAPNSSVAAPALADGPELIAPVYIHPTAVIHPSAKIGPNVSVGPRAMIGRGVRLREAIILDSVDVKNDSCIIRAVVGWESKIGSWCRIEGGVEHNSELESATEKGFKRPTASILGKGVTVDDELNIRDCIVLPHKELKISFHREIIM